MNKNRRGAVLTRPLTKNKTKLSNFNLCKTENAKQFLHNDSGITLISLVITIIVLVILASVSLSLISGGDGIIGKASKAVSETQVAALKEEMNMAMIEIKADYFDDLGKGKTKKGFKAYLKKLCQDNGDIYEMSGNRKVFLDAGILWYIASNGDKAKITIDNDGNVEIKEIETADGATQDFTTEDSLTQEVEDAIKDLENEYKDKYGEEGSEDVTFEEFIKDKIENSDEGYIETEDGGKISVDNNGNLIYTDSSSTPNSSNITFDENGKAQVENPTINDGSSENIYPVIALTPANTLFKYEVGGTEITSTTWTNQSITVTAIPNIDITGYTIQTSTNGLKWNNTATQNFTENGNMYVRLWNGSKSGGAATASVGTIEKTAPTVNVTDSTSNSITFSASDTKGTNENASGVAGYIVQLSSVAAPTKESNGWIDYDGSSITVGSLTQGNSYNVFVKDNAGNVSTAGNGETGNVTDTSNSNVTITVTSWNGTTANITISTSVTGGYIRYKVGSGSLSNAILGSTTTTATSGETVSAYLCDSSGQYNGSAVTETPILTYTVSYNGNGATNGSMSNSSHSYGTSKALTTNVYSKTGYTFTVWNTKEDGSGTSYSDGQSVTNLSSTNGATVTLYAQWTANTYTITLNNQSATTAGTSSVSITYGSTTLSNISVPSRTGYTFGGYYTELGGSGTQIINESGGWINTSNTTFTSNMTLYAKWKEYLYLYNNGTLGGGIGGFSYCKIPVAPYSGGEYNYTDYNYLYHWKKVPSQWSDDGMLSINTVDVTDYNTLTFIFDSSSYMCSSQQAIAYDYKIWESVLYCGLSSLTPGTNMSSILNGAITRKASSTDSSMADTVNSKRQYILDRIDVDISEVNGNWRVGTHLQMGSWACQEIYYKITQIYLH